MKELMVSMFGGEPYSMWKIENADELMMHIEHYERIKAGELGAALKNTCGSDIYELMGNFGQYAKKENCNLIDNIVSSLSRIAHGKIKLFQSSGHLLINPRTLSYCVISRNHDILSEKDIVPSFKSKTHKIKNETKVLNLENDSELEQESLKYLVKRDPNYSYIKHLRSYSKAELGILMQDFVQKGGEELFIYTTASDFEQLKKYMEEAIEAGIKKYVFKFSATPEQEVLDFLKAESETKNVKLVIL